MARWSVTVWWQTGDDIQEEMDKIYRNFLYSHGRAYRWTKSDTSLYLCYDKGQEPKEAPQIHDALVALLNRMGYELTWAVAGAEWFKKTNNTFGVMVHPVGQGDWSSTGSSLDTHPVKDVPPPPYRL